VNPIHLTSELTIILDFVAWLAIHLGTAWLGSRLPAAMFERDAWLYRPRAWEQAGDLYVRGFRVKRWKHLLPDGAVVFPGGFAKRRLLSTSREYLDAFIRETSRAELTHWLAVLPVPVFFFWNPWPVGVVMVLYAMAANWPCIITQRYNRGRLVKALALRTAAAGRHVRST
jgi:glycosyl-4,4'-diaponeurosporenoate acyltransferase